MKFKVKQNTKTFKRLQELRNRVIEVEEKARQTAKEFGSERYAARSHRLAGGIGAIEFDTKPEGWKHVGKRWQDLFYPKANNKKDLEKILSLPTIEYSELNEIVGFEGPQTVTSSGGGLAWVNTVGLVWDEDNVLIETRGKFTPSDDLVEILESEYIELSNKIQK